MILDFFSWQMTFFRGGPRGAPPQKNIQNFVPKVSRYIDRKSQKIFRPFSALNKL